MITSKYYPVKTKKQAVQYVQAGLLSEEQACHKYHISSKLLYRWMRWHEKYFVQPYINPDLMTKNKNNTKSKLDFSLLEETKRTLRVR